MLTNRRGECLKMRFGRSPQDADRSQQRRLILLHLDHIFTARLVNLRGGFGVAVMRIERDFLALKRAVLQQVSHHRNLTALVALHRHLRQHRSALMAHRQDQRLFLLRATQYLAIDRHPILVTVTGDAHSKMALNQRVECGPVQAG